jgi:hypothetical protein
MTMKAPQQVPNLSQIGSASFFLYLLSLLTYPSFLIDFIYIDTENISTYKIQITGTEK